MSAIRGAGVDAGKLAAIVCIVMPVLRDLDEASRVSSFAISKWPRPAVDLGLVDAELVRVVRALDLHVAKLLLRMSARDVKRRDAVDHVLRDCESVDLILDREVERRVDVALLLVAAHVQVPVIGPA